MMDELTRQIEELKTDENELEELMQQYDLDTQLETEFNTLSQLFHQLEIKYQSLKNARRFLQYGNEIK